MGRHVAGESRIAIVPPGTAEIGRLFKDGDVGYADFSQLDRGHDTGRSGADDGYAQCPGLGHALIHCSSAWAGSAHLLYIRDCIGVATDTLVSARCPRDR